MIAGGGSRGRRSTLAYLTTKNDITQPFFTGRVEGKPTFGPSQPSALPGVRRESSGQQIGQWRKQWDDLAVPRMRPRLIRTYGADLDIEVDKTCPGWVLEGEGQGGR
jgi:hypothetical protein